MATVCGDFWRFVNSIGRDVGDHHGGGSSHDNTCFSDYLNQADSQCSQCKDCTIPANSKAAWAASRGRPQRWQGRRWATVSGWWAVSSSLWLSWLWVGSPSEIPWFYTRKWRTPCNDWRALHHAENTWWSHLTKTAAAKPSPRLLGKSIFWVPNL